MSYKNTISIGKTIDVLKDIYGKNHWCHRKIRYLWVKPLMSSKNTIFMRKTIDAISNTISMGESIDVIFNYDIYTQNHWCLKRYLWAKPLMSYKNTISLWKTYWCHIKLQYLCDKPLMSYKIYVGKTIDVI